MRPILTTACILAFAACKQQAVPTVDNLPPFVDAGGAQVAEAGTTVQLVGTATDVDGSVVSFEWTQASGGPVSLDRDGPRASFVAPELVSGGTLVFELTVVDDAGAESTDQTSIYVPPPAVGLPPVVDAGPPITVSEGTQVDLVGTASDDGVVVSTTWGQVSGAPIVLADPSSLSTSFTAPPTAVIQSLVLELEATDDDGSTTSATTVVTVVPDNQPPMVDAGPTLLADAGAGVGLAVVATDPDGTIDTLLWTQLAGPAVTLDDPSSATPSFTAPSQPVASTLLFEVVATDNEGATGFDQVIVDVAPNTANNVPPVVDAGVDVDVLEGDLVALTGIASDSDGTLVATTWTQLSGPATALADPTMLATDFVAPTVTQTEVLVWRLEAVDDGGATAFDTMAVRVDPINLPPIADAGIDTPITALAMGTLQGTASDPDGTVISTLWEQTSGPTVVLDDPSSLSATFDAPDVVLPTPLEFRLTVEDDEGAQATDTVVWTVEPATPANQPPVVYAGPDQSLANGSAGSLAGSASDPDGVVQTTTWTQISGPTVTLSDTSVLDPTFTAPTVQCAVALVFELEAIDDGGASRTDQVSVIVEGSGTNVTSIPLHLPLETDDGGLLAEGGVWEWGVAASGPNASWDGSNLWATTLGGTYPNNSDAWLCLPAIDRGGASDTVLSFRYYGSHGSGDGTAVEVLTPDQGWVTAEDVQPAYDGPPGQWGSVGVVPPFELVTVAIPADVPDPVRLRFAFQSDGGFLGPGSYIDEIRVDAETSDPDGDGIVGVRDEADAGTDPFLADTDGDGFDDGTEAADGTDPNDPSDFLGDTTLVAPFQLDFETDSGPLVATGIWEHGTPSSGNTQAASGVNVWGTDLSSIYPNNSRSLLYLPQIDLAGLVDPTLSFALWSRIGSGESLSVQIHDGADWVVLAPATPDYSQNDALGQAGFGTQGRASNYVPAAFSLGPWAGQVVRLRLSFNTDGGFTGAGALIDDLAVTDEADDPDNDGLSGVLGEIALGTDPFSADTDLDGALDGDEESSGTDPLNPVDYPGAPTLAVGSHLDLEVDPGGTATEGEAWEWGAIGGGPQTSWDGANGWGTVLNGITTDNFRSAIYLPPVDLTGETQALLTLRIWAAHASGDATTVQAYEPVGRTWEAVTPLQPDYDGFGPDGDPGWRTQGYLSEFVLAYVPLDAWVGQTVRLRLLAGTDGGFNGAGAYVDELRIDVPDADPDADTLTIDEERLAGTDPYVSDTDGDLVDDGTELSDATDPLDPASNAAADVWTVGHRETLDTDGGGLATVGDTWEFGTPGQGPTSGFSGDRVWATGLLANYGPNLREALHFPTLDLTGATAPSLSMRMWFDSSDAVSFEIKDPVIGWTALGGETPAYNTTDAIGIPAWNAPTSANAWDLVGVDLTPYAGQVVQVRLIFRTDSGFQSRGIFLDEIALDEEGVDYDGDTLFGILDERGLYGTDPFVTDTDGDGIDDGAEVLAGTDPLDPADP